MVEKIVKLGLYKNLKSCGLGSGLFWGFLGGLFVFIGFFNKLF